MSSQPERLGFVREEIRIALDTPAERIVFTQWGTIKGANARSLLVLAASHQEAVHNGRAPENFPFILAAKLSGEIGCDEETLRKRVHRCRKRIAQMASKVGDPAPSDEAVIENIPWHGYRLNPDRVRIVMMSEVAPSEKVTVSEKKSHLAVGK